MKEKIGNSSSLTCDPIPTPVVGLVKIAKALKEDVKFFILKKETIN